MIELKYGYTTHCQEIVAKARNQQLCLETIDVSLLLQEVCLMDLLAASLFETSI